MEALKVRDHVDSWNDDRLDELAQGTKEGFAKVDARFDKVEGEMKEGFAKVDARFKKVDERLAEMPTREEMNKGLALLRSDMNVALAELRSNYTALNRTLIAGAVAIIVALIGFHG